KISEEDETVVINNRSFLGSAIVKRVKACPDIACQKLNVKMGDDNLIVCEECLEQYCFLCGEAINGLKHFKKKCKRPWFLYQIHDDRLERANVGSGVAVLYSSLDVCSFGWASKDYFAAPYLEV
ncbi:unnamed protein product, partial [Adineta ricciae]